MGQDVTYGGRAPPSAHRDRPLAAALTLPAGRVRAVEVTMCSPAGCRSRLAAVIAGPRAASPRSSNFSQISLRVGKAGSAVARPTITGLAAVWSCPRQVMTHQPAATMLRY